MNVPLRGIQQHGDVVMDSSSWDNLPPSNAREGVLYFVDLSLLVVSEED